MCQANWVIRGHRAYFMTRVFSVFSKDTHLRVVNKANWFFCLRAAEQASAATVSGAAGCGPDQTPGSRYRGTDAPIRTPRRSGASDKTRTPASQGLPDRAWVRRVVPLLVENRAAQCKFPESGRAPAACSA